MPSIWSSLRHQSCSFPTLPMSSQWSVMHRVRFQRHALPRHQPIAFFICPIAARHAKLVASKREMIGLVQAVCHWMPNLGGGGTFLVKTDHYSLKFLLDQRLSMIPQHQWVSKLLGFDFRIEYKLGISNVVIDALSHRDTEESATLLMLSVPRFQLFTNLQHGYGDDTQLRALRDKGAASSRSRKWALVDDLITVTGQVYIASASTSIATVLATAHGAGHEVDFWITIFHSLPIASVLLSADLW
jgi:hypothetical protein